MTPPSNAFIFAPMFNAPPDTANPQGNDATGAFQPGAQMFANYWNKQQAGSANTPLLFNNHASERGRFDEILHGLAISPYQLDTVAYFGHGTEDLLVSAKIGPGYLDEFVASLRGNCGPGATIILYACSCGAPGGIAEQIANKLSDLSPTVFAHATAGHAFRNPVVRRFPGGTRTAPPYKVAAWITAIEDTSNDLWIRFPFMTADEISNELS
jgi:hypothetical protein